MSLKEFCIFFGRKKKERKGAKFPSDSGGKGGSLLCARPPLKGLEEGRGDDRRRAWGKKSKSDLSSLNCPEVSEPSEEEETLEGDNWSREKKGVSTVIWKGNSCGLSRKGAGRRRRDEEEKGARMLFQGVIFF